MEASTFRQRFSDDELALSLAKQQELPPEQVRCAEKTICCQDSISGTNRALAEQSGDLAVRLGDAGLDEHFVNTDPIELGGQLNAWHFGGDGLQGGL